MLSSPSAVQDRRVDVANVQPVFDRVQADFVGGADRLPASDAAAGHPHGEAGRVVVAAVALFAHRRAAELAAPDDERLVEQAALLEVLRAGRRSACPSRGRAWCGWLRCSTWASHLLPAP